MKTIEKVALRPVPLLDLRAQYATFRKEVGQAIERVLDSQHFILGGEVKAFEQKAADYCGVRVPCDRMRRRDRTRCCWRCSRSKSGRAMK